MKAVIMAGGEGTRLRPLTQNLPKPMVKVMDVPVMEHIINLLKEYGIANIAVTLMYLPQVITDYFKDGSSFGVNIEYFTETMPLGTAGSVKNCEETLTEDFIVISGDCLTDINLKNAMDFHAEKNAEVTVVLTRVENPSQYGIAILDKNGKINNFLEKPSEDEAFSDTVNTGIYIIKRDVLKNIPPNTTFDFSKDLFPEMLKQQRAVYGYVAEGYWCDIGDLNAYLNCHFDIFDQKVKIRIPALCVGKDIYISKNAIVEDGARLSPKVFIGNDAHIEKGVLIEPYTVIGQSDYIISGTRVGSSVLLDNVRVSGNSQINGSIVSNNVVIKDSANLLKGSVIGDNAIIGSNSKINSDIKVYADKIIEDETVVTENIIKTQSVKKSPFSDFGVDGEVNVDLTCELALKLGNAIGTLYKSAKASIAYDFNHSSLMLKYAFVSGLMSTGASIYDFGSSNINVLRNAITFYGLDYGIYISGKEFSNIQFVSNIGVNIDRQTERKLEGLLSKDEYTKLSASKINAITNVSNFKLYYIRNMLRKFKYKLSDSAVDIKADDDTVKEYIYTLYNDLKIDFTLIAKEHENNNKIFAQITENGEMLTLYDEMGNKVTRPKLFALLAYIMLKTNRVHTLVLPSYASVQIESLAQEYGIRTVRAKSFKGDFMKTVLIEGGMDHFSMYFDAVFSLAKILEYLELKNIKLSKLLTEIPDIYILEKRVKIKNKPEAMRKLIEENETNKVDLTDGVKIFTENGWTLIIPESNKPYLKIITEGFGEEYAKELSDFYTNKLGQ